MNATTMIAAAALTAAAVAPTAASAQSSVPASATSNPNGGMAYTAGSADNDVRVRLAGSTFTIDDVVPIQAGAGCAPVAGDLTKVICTAFKNGTGPAATFMRFFVNLGEGDDKVINQTNSGAAGAPMLAYGNPGDDTLIGGDGTNDTLRGSSGHDTLRGGNETSIGEGNETVGRANDVLDGGANDDKIFGGNGLDHLDGEGGNDVLDGGDATDILDGGLGTDFIDGGAGDPVGSQGADTVEYKRNTRVRVDLRRTNPSQGSIAENDTIRRVENIRGGTGDDTLIGDGANNTIDGGAGNDELLGDGNVDVLIGDVGRDTLIPSLSADGAPDIMDCDEFGGFGGDGANGDLAYRFAADGDSVRDCEQVFDL